MQTKNPFLEEAAKLSEQAMGMAQAAGEEMKTMFMTQGERMAVSLDLVRRDELDAVKAALTAEIAALRAEVAALRSPPATPPAGAVPSAGDAG